MSQKQIPSLDFRLFRDPSKENVWAKKPKGSLPEKIFEVWDLASPPEGWEFLLVTYSLKKLPMAYSIRWFVIILVLCSQSRTWRPLNLLAHSIVSPSLLLRNFVWRSRRALCSSFSIHIFFHLVPVLFLSVPKLASLSLHHSASFCPLKDPKDISPYVSLNSICHLLC